MFGHYLLHFDIDLKNSTKLFVLKKVGSYNTVLDYVVWIFYFDFKVLLLLLLLLLRIQNQIGVPATDVI